MCAVRVIITFRRRFLVPIFHRKHGTNKRKEIIEEKKKKTNRQFSYVLFEIILWETCGTRCNTANVPYLRIWLLNIKKKKKRRKKTVFLTNVFRKETGVPTITFSLKVRLNKRYRARLWTRWRNAFIFITL